MLGMPVRSPSTGAARRASAPRTRPPASQGRRCSIAPQRCSSSSIPRRGRGLRSACTRLGSRTRPASIFGPSLPRTAGSSVRVAARTATTESMIPSAIDRNAGLGTSSTVDSDTRTVTPENAIALPAVPMVSATASTAACFRSG